MATENHRSGSAPLRQRQTKLPYVLNVFAESIGLKREWLQKKRAYFLHYDLTPARRAAAVRSGAQEVRLMDWLRNRTAPKQEAMEL